MYLFFNLIYIGVYISIPIIIVLLLKNKLLKRYSCKFNSFLCGLIFFRMLFLIRFRIEMTINDFFTGDFEFNIIPNENSDIQLFLRDQIYLNENLYNLFQILMFIWIFAFLFLLIKMIMYNTKLYRYLYRYSKEIEDEEIIKILNSNKKQLKIRSNVKLFTIKNLNSALLTTFGKNKIFMPNVVYSKDELNLVLKHELIHLKRKDNFKKLLINILTCIYWFNPLVKKLNLYFEELCELSNDEEIIKEASNREKRQYASLLLKTRNEQLKKYTIYLNGSFFARDKKSNLKSRIEEILSKILKKEYYIIMPLLIILFFSSICSIYYTSIDFETEETQLFFIPTTTDLEVSDSEQSYIVEPNFFENKYGKTYGRCIQLQDGEKKYPDLIEVGFDEKGNAYIINTWQQQRSSNKKRGYIKKEDYLKIEHKTEYFNYNYSEMIQTKCKTINVYDKNGEKIIGKYSNI